MLVTTCQQPVSRTRLATLVRLAWGGLEAMFGLAGKARLRGCDCCMSGRMSLAGCFMPFPISTRRGTDAANLSALALVG